MEENIPLASQKKRRLYVALLIFQVLLVFYPMFLNELIIQQRASVTTGFLNISRAIIILFVLIINSFFVKEFISNIKWFYLVIAFNVIIFLASTISHTFPVVSNDPELFRVFHLISCLSVIITLGLTFWGAVKDIFKLRHDLGYSLLGAANIFLLIGSVFSFIINISGTVYVGMVLPLDQLTGLDVYSNELAFYTLAGIDPPYDTINKFIKNILVVESIFAQLFVVIIIGRLLSK